MKTINEECDINSSYYEYSDSDVAERAFKAGVDFAQQWIDVKDELPEGKNDINNSDIKCLCIVHGIDMCANEYTEYKVLMFRPSLKCFIEWAYNGEGSFDSIKYNDVDKSYPHKPIVTHWRPINKI